MKSKKRGDGIVVKKDGREILSPYQWAKRRAEVWERDSGRCVRCSRVVPLNGESAAEIHHKQGRGIGGSLRDDRLEALETLCFTCHRGHHQGAKVVPRKVSA